MRSEVDRTDLDDAVVALLEHCLYARSGPRASAVVLIIDYGGVGLRNVDLGARWRELHILKTYYPDAIGQLVMVNHPR